MRVRKVGDSNREIDGNSSYLSDLTVKHLSRRCHLRTIYRSMRKKSLRDFVKGKKGKSDKGGEERKGKMDDGNNGVGEGRCR